MGEFLLRELEKYMQVSVLRDKNGPLGTHLLPIGDTLEVWITELNPQGIMFKSIVSTLPTEQDKEALFSFLMEANYLGQGTGGSVLALDPDEKFLTLSLVIPYEVNYRQFRDRLEDFVNYLDYWKRRQKPSV